MKKLVLVLGIATLFSCEKEEGCKCKLELEHLNDNGIWENVSTYHYENGDCNKASDWQVFGVDRQKYSCK